MGAYSTLHVSRHNARFILLARIASGKVPDHQLEEMLDAMFANHLYNFQVHDEAKPGDDETLTLISCE